MTNILSQILQDPMNQFNALTSGDPMKMSKALFAPSLITQDQGGPLADWTRFADNSIAGYFGGPFGKAGSQMLHMLNDSYAGRQRNRNGGLFGL